MTPFTVLRNSGSRASFAYAMLGAFAEVPRERPGDGKASLPGVLRVPEFRRHVRGDTVTGHTHLSWSLLALVCDAAEQMGVPRLYVPLQSVAGSTGQLAHSNSSPTSGGVTSVEFGFGVARPSGNGRGREGWA
jgi:hypothetical protein